MTSTGTLYSRLVNHESLREYNLEDIQTFCKEDNEPLVAQYDLDRGMDKNILSGRVSDMWRYQEVLPLFREENIVTLGEGFTPLLPLNRLSNELGIAHILLKDESGNPTGSFKARGLGMAVSKAKELGIREFCIPTAGNAGSALSAYCAAGGMKAHIFMPVETPSLFQIDCRVMGARVTLIDGNIADCAKAMKAENKDGQWFDVSTLKEPFRLEGKKTMGYEIAEQMNWTLPDVVIYPTGGGTGLIGIWKAFMEMKQMGWVDHIPTRMVAVQIDGCNPIVQAFQKGDRSSVPFTDPQKTIANGLRVPHAFGHKLILKALYDSRGTVYSVSEQNMIDATKEFAEKEGHFLCPEGAAVWHACKSLHRKGWIKEEDSVVLLNTGSGYKYVENVAPFI